MTKLETSLGNMSIMSNPELTDAWRKKLPGVIPTDRDMTAFALGTEVGFERAYVAMAADAQQVAVPQGWANLPAKMQTSIDELQAEVAVYRQGCDLRDAKIAELNSLLAAAPQPPVGDASAQEPARNLHREIMNMPVGTGDAGLNINQRLAYKIGHRAARHAAAELALSAPPAPEQLLQSIAEFGELQNQLPQTREPERFSMEFTAEQVQALYLTLWRGRLGGKKRPETRPAYGWMEQPLVAIEDALESLHRHIHDRSFNAMNRQFFGNDSRSLPVTDAPAMPLRPRCTGGKE